MGRLGELPIPPAAQSDLSAIELVRVWASDGKQHVSVATGVWNDPAAWGIMLVDLARHVAGAYHDAQRLDPATVLDRIKAGFDAEWSVATDKPQGGLLG
jgi:hypothetical protein